jgi:AraC family transcriptional regulator
LFGVLEKEVGSAKLPVARDPDRNGAILTSSPAIFSRYGLRSPADLIRVKHMDAAQITTAPMAELFPARLSSRPEALRRHAWQGGAFTTAYRPATRFVEGEIASPNHLIMVTLRGGAERHEIRTDDGHRYDGPDRPGSVSFLPASCARKLRLHSVEWRWATVAVAPGEQRGALAALPPFSGVDDGFVQTMLTEFERLDALDGGLEPIWRETMVQALVAYLGRRYGGAAEPSSGAVAAGALPPWRLRQVDEMVDTRLSGDLRIADLAALCRLSEGHFHRAFRAATGLTPLQHVTARRIDRAQQLLARSDLSIGVVALKVGFLSPNHFARLFQQATGKSPADYRRAFRVA